MTYNKQLLGLITSRGMFQKEAEKVLEIADDFFNTSGVKNILNDSVGDHTDLEWYQLIVDIVPIILNYIDEVIPNFHYINDIRTLDDVIPNMYIHLLRKSHWEMCLLSEEIQEE